MRVVCVWREGYDYSRIVQDWLVEFERISGKEVESIDPGSKAGEDFCQAYGVVEYPAILVLGPNGTVVAEWKGKMMPRFDEVNYWA